MLRKEAMQVREKGKKWNPVSWHTLFLFLLINIVVAHAHAPMLEEKEKEKEEDGSNEIRVKLMHRNDPRFPGNAKRGNVSRYEQIRELAHRDIIRQQKINQRTGRLDGYPERRKNWEIFQMPMKSGMDYLIGEYFVQVKIGTPARKFWLIADTGSELTWVRCKYCTGKCRHHRRKHENRVIHKRRKVFHAHRSRSFQKVPCSSQQCQVDLGELFSLAICPNPSDPCQYDFRYLDGTSAKGLFGSETLTVGLVDGKKRKLKNMLIGCTKNTTDGGGFKGAIDGILGLGIARDSFLVGAAREYGGKFSYCLVDHLSPTNISNYLSFGGYRNSKTTSLGEIKQTSLGVALPLYGLNVVGLSIGGQMLDIPSEVWNITNDAGLIIDSGTSLTLLAMPAFDSFMDAMLKGMENFDFLDEEIEPFEYCYNATGFDEGSVPRLAFHLEGGVRFEPPVKSYFVDAAPGAKCLAIIPSNWPGTSTLGNIMQQNHLWEFDLLKTTVSFAPSSCT